MRAPGLDPGVDPRINRASIDAKRWIAASTLAAYGGSPGNDGESPHRPARLGAARALRIDRDRHALLPLIDHQRRVDPAALVIELDVVAGEVSGRALVRVHGADRFGDLLAVGDARL